MALYVYKDNQQLGPFEEEDVQTAIRNGGFTINDLASRDGQGGWQPLSFYFPSEAPTSVFSTKDLPPENFGDSAAGYQAAGQDNPRRTGDFVGAADTQPLSYYVPPVYQPPVPYQGYQPPAPQYQMPYGTPRGGSDSGAQIGFAMGIVTLVLMSIGLIPCFGWVNYFTLSIGTITLILCAVQMSNAPPGSETHNKLKTALIMTGVAMVIGFIRLILGLGVF